MKDRRMYTIVYTDGCSPHVIQIRSEAEAMRFIALFLLKHKNNEDNYVDLVMCEGSIIHCDYTHDEPILDTK